MGHVFQRVKSPPRGVFFTIKMRVGSHSVALELAKLYICVGWGQEGLCLWGKVVPCGCWCCSLWLLIGCRVRGLPMEIPILTGESQPVFNGKL